MTVEFPPRPAGRLPDGLLAFLRSRPALILAPILLAVLIVLWESVSRGRLVSRIVLPPASAVGAALLTLLRADYFPAHLAATALEVLLGFTLGSCLAFALAVLLHHLPLVRQVLYPYIITFQLTPSIVLAPIFVIWFGFGIESKVVVSIATVFFVVLVSTLAGFDHTEENALLMMRSLCASRRQIFFLLTLPNALPYVFTGLKTATTMAIIGALVGEFITARAGLGVLLTQFGFALKQDLVFATVIVVVALGLVAFGLVEFAQRRIVWWRRSEPPGCAPAGQATRSRAKRRGADPQPGGTT